jgi:hypothetical protein
VERKVEGVMTFIGQKKRTNYSNAAVTTFIMLMFDQLPGAEHVFRS